MEYQIAAVYELGQRLILLHEPRQIAEAVLEIAGKVLDFQDCDFLLVDEVHRELFIAARHGQRKGGEDLRLPLEGEKGITVIATNKRQIIYIPDVRRDSRYVSTGFPAISELAVPVQIEDHVLGVINVESTQLDAFNLTSQELLSILASQAALALENAHLHYEEHRRAEELALVNRIARRVNANLDLQATLDAVVEAVVEIVPCSLAEISLWDQEQGMLSLQALRSTPERAFPVGQVSPPGKGYTAWVVRHKQPLLVPDVAAREDIQPDLFPGELPFAAYLGLPLMAGEHLIGALVLVHDQANTFSEKDLHLLESLSEQAAAAICNARLYKELNGLYEETQRQAHKLAALNAVAAVINQPLSLQEILDRAIAKVIEVMETEGGGIRLLNQETGELPIAASHGLSPALIQSTHSIRLGEGIVGDVAQSGQPQVIKDMSHDPRIIPSSILAKEGFNTFAVVPLRAKDRIIGTLGVVTRQERDFIPEDMEILTAVGDQIGVAVENARLYTDLARHVRQLEAIHAVAEVVNRTEELDQILKEGLKQILAVTGMEMGAIALTNPENQILSIQACQGISRDFVSWLGEKLKTKPLEPDTWPEDLDFYFEEPLLVYPTLPKQVLEEGLRLYAEIPLFAEGDLVGVLIVATHGSHSFTTDEKVLLTAVGHQLGIAIADARLRQEALVAERLASIGRVATSVAHDLRSPLGGIQRSAEFLTRPELPSATRQKLSKSIASLSRMLINTSQQILDYVQNERLTSTRAPSRLTEFLNEVLSVLEIDFSDQGIEVEKKLRFRGEVRLDGDRMAQVIYNIASNARDAMPEGGIFKVSTRKLEDQVELVMSDTGPGVPQELSERIFDPFFSFGKRQGVGLGLAIVKRIVEEHGGTIRLKSAKGWGATFVITLPLY